MSEPLSEEEMRQRLAAGLHALDCTRCHRGAYCGGIGEDDLGRAELLMDDVVTDLLAEAWLYGHAAGRDYQADGWNCDAHDPEQDNPYSR